MLSIWDQLKMSFRSYLLLPKRHSFYHTAFRQKPGLCEAKSYAQIATQRDFDAF